MTHKREHDDFVRRLRELKTDPLFKSRLKAGMLDLKSLSEKEVDNVIRRADDAGFYFLMVAPTLDFRCAPRVYRSRRWRVRSAKDSPHTLVRNPDREIQHVHAPRGPVGGALDPR